MNEIEIFEKIGADGISKMVAAFYRKVPADDILGKMYPADDMEGSEERLREFLLYRLSGGVHTRYTEKRGHPRLRMRHAAFEINFRGRDRWVKLMDEAMDEAGIPDEVSQELHRFFFDVADFLRNVPENDGPFKI